jgi:hypothetical protein
MRLLPVHYRRRAAHQPGRLAYLTKPLSAKSLIEPLQKATARQWWRWCRRSLCGICSFAEPCARRGHFPIARQFFYATQSRGGKKSICRRKFSPSTALGPAITWRQLEVLEVIEALEAPIRRRIEITDTAERCSDIQC